MAGPPTRPPSDLGRRFVGLACRAGYAARGFVYVSIGIVALLAAADLTPHAQSAVGALRAWAQWPAGLALLWLIGVGLWGFTGWRVLQSIFDADRQGAEPMALASRAGQALSGFVYGALAVSVFGILDVIEDMGEAEDRDATSSAVDKALAMPGGEWLVIGLGLFILACGVGNLVQSVKRDFCEGLTCDKTLARKAAIVGRLGYGARGLVFLAAGGFVVLAGLHARSGEAKGTGAAMDWLEGLPFGEIILAAVAAGLIAFGAFAFVEAAYRKLHVRSVIKS